MGAPHPAAIDFDAVEQLLKKARAQAGSATATTLNIIIYVDDEDLEARANAKAEALAKKYPARVMILHTDTEEAKVRSSVSHIGEGTTINAESIELGIADMSAAAVCSAIEALRVPDIPNVLWWTSATVANEALFDALIAMMDTVIVDSSGGADGEHGAISELAQFFSGNKPVLMRDLAYMRLAPWQDMVAQFFDNADFLSDLHRIERVEIASGSSAEGYYLVAWLASRLNWKACGRFSLCDPSGRAVRVELKKDGDLRRVLRVALSTADTTFSADLTDSPDTVCLSMTGAKNSPKRCSPLPHIDNLSLLEKAFLIAAHDEVFEASIRTVYDLLQFES